MHNIKERKINIKFLILKILLALFILILPFLLSITYFSGEGAWQGFIIDYFAYFYIPYFLHINNSFLLSTIVSLFVGLTIAYFISSIIFECVSKVIKLLMGRK